MFLGKHKKTSSVKRHCGALCFQNKCFLLFICFFIIHFLFFFFSRLLQAAAGRDKEYLCEKDTQVVTYLEKPIEKQRENMKKNRGVDTRDRIEYLPRQDCTKLRLIDKIDEIERMTDEKFKDVLDTFRQTTEKSKRQNDKQQKLRDKVQNRFNEHKKN